VSQLDLYNLSPYSIPQARPTDVGFFEGVGIGARETLPDLSFNLVSDAFSYNTGEQTISEQEWRNSPYWRENLKYHPKLNWDWAKALAERHDDNADFSRLHERMGTGAEIGAFVGSLGTGLIDPINWIALPASFTANLVRQTGSRLIASALHGAASNLAVEAVLAPLQATSAEIMQEKYGLAEFAQQATVSGTLGLLFGGAGNLLSTRLKNRRQQRQSEAPTAETTTTVKEDSAIIDTPSDRGVEQTPAQRTEQDVTIEPQREQLPQTETPQTQTPPQFGDINQQTNDELATAINKLIKTADTDEGKRGVLKALATQLTRERFVELSQMLRNARKDRKISSRWYRELFDDLAGDKPSNALLSLDTKVGAIWDRLNDEKSIIDADVLLDTVDSEYVRVLETRDGLPENVSEDRFVVFDVIGAGNTPSLEGTRLGLARSINEVADFLLRNKHIKQVEVRVLDDSSSKTVGIDDLIGYLNDLREQTGINRIAAVLDGQTVADTKMPEQFSDNQFDTLETAWQNVKNMYDQHNIQDITDAADQLVAAVKTPEDMAEMIQNLRAQLAPDDITARMLDEAEMITNDLTAQREALREAYMCLLS